MHANRENLQGDFPKISVFLRKGQNHTGKAKLVKTNFPRKREQNSEIWPKSLAARNNQRDCLFMCRGFGSVAGELGSFGPQWPSQRCFAENTGGRGTHLEEHTCFRRSARNLFASLEGRRTGHLLRGL